MTRLFALLILFCAETALAQTFSVQGVLRDPNGRVVDDGEYVLDFALYDVATQGDPLWTETQENVQVINGVFVADLGSVNPLTGLTFQVTYWLGIQVNKSEELTPRTKLAPNPYSLAVLGTQNRFTSDGNVGVGTTDPQSKLHVVGDLRMEGSLLFPDGSSMSSADIGSAGIVVNEESAFIEADTDATNDGAVIMRTQGVDRMHVNALEAAFFAQDDALEGGQFRLMGPANDHARSSIVDNIAGDFRILAEGQQGHLLRHKEGATMFAGHGAPGGDQNMWIGVHDLNNAGGTGPWLWVHEHATGKFFLWDGNSVPLYITGENRLGIGTPDPLAPLHVTTLVPTSITSFGFLGTDGRVGATVVPPIDVPVSIRADHRIWAAEFNAISDARIKNAIGVSDGAQDLETLKRLEVTDYTYVDVATKGNKPSKKLIAQQVKEVYPRAVSQGIGFVPDVYQMSERTSFADRQLQVTTAKEHGFAVGDTVRVIFEEGAREIPVLAVADAHTFTVSAEKAHDQVFVFGKQVHDFHTVDYEAVAMLNVSATQELSRKVDALRDENDALRAQLAGFAQQMARLEAAVAAQAATDELAVAGN